MLQLPVWMAIGSAVCGVCTQCVMWSEVVLVRVKFNVQQMNQQLFNNCLIFRPANSSFTAS